jgi:hypothetical protein
MPLETGASETQQPQHHSPVPSTSRLSLVEQSDHPVLGYNVVQSNFPGVTYLDQSFQLPVMPLTDPYFQTGLMDPSFFALYDIPTSDLDPNLFLPPSFD